MKIMKIICGVCFLLAVGMLIWFTSGNHSLYKDYVYDISPQKSLLEKRLTERYGDKYKLYAANFTEEDKIPELTQFNENAILWLGAKKFNYAQSDIKNIKNYGIVLCSDFNNLFLTNFFAREKAQQFPIFLPEIKSLKKSEKYYALLGKPEYAETILKEMNLPYERFNYAEIAQLENNLADVKAIIIGQNKQGRSDYNIEPVILNAVINKIPVIEEKTKNAASPQSSLRDVVHYYYNRDELRNSLNISAHDITLDEGKRWVQKYFTADAAWQRLTSILEKDNQKNLGEHRVDLHTQNITGFHPYGDIWLISDLKQKLKNESYLTFQDTGWRPQSDISLHLIGWIDIPDEELTGKNNILWFSYPYGAATEVGNPDKFIKRLAKLSSNFQKTAVASKKMQRKLAEEGCEVEYIPQFTNTTKFYPDFDEDKKSDILFVGNNCRYRKVAFIAKKHNLPLTIYGLRWPKGWAKAPYVDNRILRKYYSSAKIVLSDQNEYMTDFGFIVNRIYDATACNTLVISEYVEAAEEIYGDCVPMFKTEEEFVKLVNYYLTHEEERLQKAQCAYEITLKNFTSDIVAKKFDKMIDEIRQENQK